MIEEEDTRIVCSQLSFSKKTMNLRNTEQKRLKSLYLLKAKNRQNIVVYS